MLRLALVAHQLHLVHHLQHDGDLHGAFDGERLPGEGDEELGDVAMQHVQHTLGRAVQLAKYVLD